jgi:hypothetical protein
MSRYTLTRKNSDGDVMYASYELMSAELGLIAVIGKYGDRWLFNSFKTVLGARELEIAAQVLRKLEKVGFIEGEWVWVN